MNDRPKTVYDARAFEGGVAVWLGRSFVGDEYEVALALHRGGRHYSVATGVDGDGRIVWEDVEPNTAAPTVLRLPEHVLEALLKACADLQQPTPAMQRHLDDAIATRDRLLELVERGWDA